MSIINPYIYTSADIVCLSRLLHIFVNSIYKLKCTGKQSKLGLHCLTVRLLKRFNRRQNLVYVVVISAKFMVEVGIWHRVIIFQEIYLIIYSTIIAL